MTDEHKDEKDAPKDQPAPHDQDDDPVADLKRGVGLLFRAAKNAAHTARGNVKTLGVKAPDQAKIEQAFKSGVDELHKAIDRLKDDKVEGALKSSLQEIGRAFGNVAQTLERELSGRDEDKKD